MTEPAPARAARERIETERLALTAPSLDDAPESLDFYLRNIAHFARCAMSRPCAQDGYAELHCENDD